MRTMITVGALSIMIAQIAGGEQIRHNSPKPVDHALDHVVVAVRDLDEAQSKFQLLGFTVTPRSVHPFGTSNRLVVFRTNFLELLAITDPKATDKSEFVHYIESVLASGEGPYSVGLTSFDIHSDYEALRKQGADPSEPFFFERRASLPGGTEGVVKAAATAWFTKESSLASLFYSQQLSPQYIWVPDWQRHANGATSLRSVTIIAENLSQYKTYLASMILGGTVKTESGGVVASTSSGLVEVVTPAEFERLYRVAGAKTPSPLPRVAAVKIAVANLAKTHAFLASRRIPVFERPSGSLVIPPSRASGLVIEFVH